MRRSFVLWLLILSAATAAPAQPQSRIAFQSLRTGNWDIYVANADGSQVVNITRTSATDYSPAWAPNGDRIAFESDRSGDFQIYVANDDGTDVVQLTDKPNSSGPAWSPNGRHIYFMRERVESTSDARLPGKYTFYINNIN